MKTKLVFLQVVRTFSNRLQLEGNFHIPAAHFTNEKVQDKIDR